MATVTHIHVIPADMSVQEAQLLALFHGGILQQDGKRTVVTDRLLPGFRKVHTTSKTPPQDWPPCAA